MSTKKDDVFLNGGKKGVFVVPDDVYKRAKTHYEKDGYTKMNKTEVKAYLKASGFEPTIAPVQEQTYELVENKETEPVASQEK